MNRVLWHGTHNDDNTVPARVDLHTANTPAMLARDVANVRRLLLDLEEGLVGVLLLVEGGDVGRTHALLERGVEDADDTGEPGGDGRDKVDGHLGAKGREVAASLALVDVVREGVGLDAAREVGLGLESVYTEMRLS